MFYKLFIANSINYLLMIYFQHLLEQKRVKGIIKLGDDRNNQMIMSHKQGTNCLLKFSINLNL